MSGYGWEMEQVIREIRRAEVILEIGTHRGGSLRVWRKEYDPLLLIGIDPSDYTTGAGWTVEDTARALNVVMVRQPSQDPETLEIVEGILDRRQIDLLFIDGDHTRAAVVADWNMYSPLVSPDGVIVIDDAVRTDSDADEGPRFLYSQLRETHRTKLIYDGHGGTGLAIVWP